MPTPLGQRCCNASCCLDVHLKWYRAVLGVGSPGSYESLPYKAIKRSLTVGLRRSFAQSIPAKGLVLASQSLQRIAPSLTRRVGPAQVAHLTGLTSVDSTEAPPRFPSSVLPNPLHLAA